LHDPLLKYSIHGSGIIVVLYLMTFGLVMLVYNAVQSQ